MKTSDKLLKAFDEFRPHINGHTTSINLFFEALEEIKQIEEELMQEYMKEYPPFSAPYPDFDEWVKQKRNKINI